MKQQAAANLRGSSDVHVSLGMVGGTHQRAALDIFEAFLQADGFIFGKLIRMNILGYFQMHTCRLQVLTDGQNITSMIHKIVHQLENIFLRFAQANHDP